MKLNMVAKLVPFSMEDTVGIQGWLQGLARQGLILDSCDNGTFLFKRDAPSPLRYRVDPTKGHPVSGPPQALLDLYAEYGWKYVDSYNRFSHVFVTGDPDALEPFHTPEALAQAIRSAAKRRIFYWSIFLVFDVLSLLFLLWRNALDDYAIVHLIMIAVGAIQVIYNIRTILAQEEKIKIQGVLDRTPAASRLTKCTQAITLMFLIYLLWRNI